MYSDLLPYSYIKLNFNYLDIFLAYAYMYTFLLNNNVLGNVSFIFIFY